VLLVVLFANSKYHGDSGQLCVMSVLNMCLCGVLIEWSILPRVITLCVISMAAHFCSFRYDSFFFLKREIDRQCTLLSGFE
jgi:hypothetical protein